MFAGLVLSGVIDAGSRVIVFVSESKTKVYDGEKLVYEEWSIVDGELKDGHKAKVVFTGNQTTVGQSKNEYTVTILDANGADVSGDYEITTETGMLSVTSRPIALSSETIIQQYDGTEIDCGEITIVEGSYATGHTPEYTFVHSSSQVGLTKNEFTTVVRDSAGVDVTANYAITTFAGDMEITKRAITLQSGSDTKEYNGVALECGVVTLVDGSYVGTDYASCTITSARTDAGFEDNLFVPKILNEQGDDVTGYYEITCLYGTLTVTPMPITLSTGSKVSKTYDGTPLRGDVSQCSFVGEKQPLIGHEATIVLMGEQTDAGESDNEVASVVIVDTNDDDRDVSFNYLITYRTNKLVVEKRRITIISQDKQWNEYTGEERTWPYYDISSLAGGVVSGQVLDVLITGAITEPGETANTVADYAIYADENRTIDVTNNYAVTVKEGTLRVVSDIIADPDGGSEIVGGDGGGGIGTGGAIPDANEIVARVYSEKAGTVYLRQYSKGAYQGNRWDSATAYTGLLDGTYSMNYLTGIALENSSQSEKAKIQIKPLMPAAAGYMLPTYLDNSESLYDIQTNDVFNSGTLTDYYTAYYFPYDYAFDETPVTMGSLGDYTNAEKDYRKFVVNKNGQYRVLPTSTQEAMDEIIQEQGWVKTDGNNRELIADVAAYVRAVKGYDLRYDTALDAQPDIAVAFLTDPQFETGICQHYATAATALFRALGFPARYTCGYVATTEANEWVDVSAMQGHAWVEVYINGVGWVTVEVTGGGGGPGVPGDGDNGDNGTDGDNKDDDSENDDDNNNDDNQDEKPDILASIEIVPNAIKKLYDGQPLVPTEANLTCKVDKKYGLDYLIDQGLIGSYQYEFSGSQTEAGKSVWSAQLFLFDEEGTDISEQFKIDCSKTGTLHVYLYTLTIATGSAEKTYDGTPLDCNEYTITGLQDGDIETIVVTGKNSGVGVTRNGFTLTKIMRDGVDVTDEYDVKKELGVLKVNEIQMTVKAASAEKTYDGTALTWKDANTWMVYSDDKLDGHTVYVTLEGELTGNVPGSCPNHIVKVSVVDENEKDVTEFYDITTIDGTLTISAPQVA